MSKRKEPEKPTGGDSIPVPVQATPVQPTPITPTISTVPPAYNGFVPADTNGTRTVSIPSGPTLTWTLYRGTRLVVEQPDDDDDETAAPSTAQPITVVSSTGTGSQSSTGGDTSTTVASTTPDVIRADPETDPDDGRRYVYCSKVYNLFILAPDLAARITGTDTYKADWVLADRGERYIPAWNKGGTSTGVSLPGAWIVNAERPQRAQTIRFTPGDTGTPVQPAKKARGDPTQLERDREQRQTAKWRDLAQQVADAPKQVPYNVKARFWVPPNEDRITLVFEPHGDLTQPKLKAAVDAAIISSKSRMKTAVVATGDGPKDNRTLFSSHYLGFYDTYVSVADARALRPNDPRMAPTKANAAIADSLLGSEEVTLTSTSVVTGLTADKIRRAAGTRHLVDSQKKVMGDTSATDFAKRFWSSAAKVGALAASEWLHRSAFSFGGLKNASNIASSQTRRNLVFGTSEANTFMIRPEDAIKGLMKAEEADSSRRGVLTSDIQYPDGLTTAWMNTKKYTWLAPKLSYIFTYRSEQNVDFNGSILIDTFQRVIPLRLEAYVDENVIKMLYASTTTSPPSQTSTSVSPTPVPTTPIPSTLPTSPPTQSQIPAQTQTTPLPRPPPPMGTGTTPTGAQPILL